MANVDMTPSRLEAFSDGVIAIVITIMVLELKVPNSDSPAALISMVPIFISYALSFLMVAVYWLNHHHLFHLVKKVELKILWSNILLLFSISLIPFFTAYMNENHMNSFSVALYSGILLLCAAAYFILHVAIGCQFRDNAALKSIERAITVKNCIALGLYVLAIAMAYFHPAISLLCNFTVALLYCMPDFLITGKEGR